MQISERASSYAKARLEKVHDDFRQADFQALKEVSSYLKVAIEVVATNNTGGTNSCHRSRLNRFAQFIKRT